MPGSLSLRAMNDIGVDLKTVCKNETTN